MINYFQEIQESVFYKKNWYEMVKHNFNMFPDLQGSCNQNRNESQEKTDCCILV